MDIILLGITIVSLVVALVMSVTAWRVTRDEKKRSAARVAALSLAAGDDASSSGTAATLDAFAPQESLAPAARPAMKAPWAAPRAVAAPVGADELPLHHPHRAEVAGASEPTISHASGFLGAGDVQRDTGSRQKSLALAAVALFAVLSGGLVWMMSRPEGTTAAAVGPNSPLELVSLGHHRENNKLAVSGLVRNPVAGQPVQNLSAVVFLFDRTGTFVTSSKANVDFLKLGPGDETPFVVSLDAPTTVARYRVSFRTDDGVVPHVDRRTGGQESAVKSDVVSRQ
jgi:hypothetical protein